MKSNNNTSPLMGDSGSMKANPYPGKTSWIEGKQDFNFYNFESKRSFSDSEDDDLDSDNYPDNSNKEENKSKCMESNLKNSTKKKQKAGGGKRGRPCKNFVEPNDSDSNENTKSKLCGVKRSSKEMAKAGNKGSKPIDPKRRERNRTLARESRLRKKEYIKSLEAEIESLKSTANELRAELEMYRTKKKTFNTIPNDPNSHDARVCIREEIMKHMENMVKNNKSMSDNDLKDCICYLDANHGLLSESRKTLIRNNIKTLIDKLLPDFVKCVFVRSEENVEFESEELGKLIRSSKYQYNEIVKKKDISDWEKCMVLMNLNKEQCHKMSELKEFAQNSRKAYTKIVKDLLNIKKEIFNELTKTNTMFVSIRESLNEVQIAKFLLWVKSDGVSAIDRYKLWGVKRKSDSFSEGEPNLTDSDEELIEKTFNSVEVVKSDQVHGSSLQAQENPGFGNMIKKFWSKYIYNGFVDFYNKGRCVMSGDEKEDLGNRMYEEYPEFTNEINLMKNMNSHNIIIFICILKRMIFIIMNKKINMLFCIECKLSISIKNRLARKLKISENFRILSLNINI